MRSERGSVAAPGHKPAPSRPAGDGLTLLTALVLLATLLLATLLLAVLLLIGLLRTRLLLTGLLLTGLLLTRLALLLTALLVLIELHRLAALGVLVFLHLVAHELRPSLLPISDAIAVPVTRL